MPVRINDSRLASLYKGLEKQSGAKIGHEQALQILASVGDRQGWSSKKVLTELKSTTLSQDQKVELAKQGLTRNEKKDLETILDKGTVPLEPGAREFLEAVVGRSRPTPQPQVDGLDINGSQRTGLSGQTKAGATIEAINISAAPEGRLHMDDTAVIGKADAQGRFTNTHLTGEQAIKEGDLVRMRARYQDGSTSDWVTIKATGIAPKDTRNAAVSLIRVGLVDKGNGTIDVSNINASRQVSEPGAQLQFTNNRTGDKATVTITDIGGFPDGFTLKGKAGDSFAVAATDGTNNTDFRTAVGNVTVPGGTPDDRDLIPDPALHKDELNADGTPRYGKTRFTGPLFVDGAKAGDVQQGHIGDCYFPSAMAALAQANPEAVQNMIKDNGDGTYSVTFKQKDWATGRFKDVEVKVDGDLWARSYGGALYGHSTNSSDAKKMELWFPLVEKAYAQWKGSYNTIGNGGLSNDVFEAVLGKEGEYQSVSPSSADRAWATLTRAIDGKQPVSAGTHGEDREALYTNTGVYADHSYSVLGYEKVGTERYVLLRNPWGQSEPAGNGPDDGVFKLKLADFAKLYSSVMYTNP